MYDWILVGIGVILAIVVLKYSLYWVLLGLGVRHKYIPLAVVGYAVLIFGLTIIPLRFLPQPRAVLAQTLEFVEVKSAELRVNLEDTVADVQDRLSATPLPTATPTPPPPPPPTLRPTCVADPASQFHSVFLRDQPSWSSDTEGRPTVKRGIELEVYRRLINSEGLWYEVRSEDGSSHYVSATVCKISGRAP